MRKRSNAVRGLDEGRACAVVARPGRERRGSLGGHPAHRHVRAVPHTIPAHPAYRWQMTGAEAQARGRRPAAELD